MRVNRVVRAVAVGTVLIAAACGGTQPAINAPREQTSTPMPVAPVTDGSPVCGFWYAIGDSPTSDEITLAAQRYGVVVLNAWETAKLHRLKQLNPAIKVLVYKDLSSTRDYAGAVDGGADAAYLPSGVGYVYAERNHPEWFARDTDGELIEWSKGYPDHWQMTVWDPAYQQYWVDQVTEEVVREGWDGVLADNDLIQLRHYTDQIVAGTADGAETDRKIRDALDEMVPLAGESLNAAGKLLVPNIAEARLFPGRWTAHSRFGGGMEENFSYPTAQGELLPFDSAQWNEMLEASRRDDRLTLLITHGDDDRLRTGFAGAALLAGPSTCWMPARRVDYRTPYWTSWQDLPLGQPVDDASRTASETWERSFDNGWVSVNPTDSTVTVDVPDGMATQNDDPAVDDELPARRGAVLVRR